MTDKTQFDPNKVPLAGINLIEASAGTGKTYTLAELYLRLVLELGLTVDQILVVTYTRAATEELRSRLRQRLVKQRQLELEVEPLDEQRLKRVSQAIQSFDEAAIYTIHGFCQRVLQDFCFESGQSFDMELTSDDKQIMQAAADDFWRQQVSQASLGFSQYLQLNKQTPEALLAAVKPLLGKPYLHYLPLTETELTVEQAVQQAQQHLQALQQCWLIEQRDVIETLTKADVLNGNKYRKASVPVWLNALQNLLARHDLPVILFDKFEKFTRTGLLDAIKKNKTLPELNFWDLAEDFLTAFEQLQANYEAQLQTLMFDLTGYLNKELPKRKQQLKIQAFDDLLLNLQQALQAEQGTLLIEQLQQQFSAALIDEFQDTDPVQYDCFSRIFTTADCPVFFVGDPKQAIYSFRGADIFTYLGAKQDARQEFSLDANWRSHPLLINAINSVFENADNPFIYEAIPFQAVEYRRDASSGLRISDQASSGLNFIWLNETVEPLNKGIALEQATETTSAQIVELIQQAEQGDVFLTDKNTDSQRRLNGGDIAVLVRSHSQAVRIQQSLRLQGINSVVQSRDSVFDSEQAIILERVLAALANPHDLRLVITALSTPLFSYNASQLYALQQDESLWSEQQDNFIELHECWKKQGVAVMLSRLFGQQNITQRLLMLADGERQLTNLMHLVELTQAQAHQQDSSPSIIASWFSQQRQATDLDIAQIRLESDEQLVKIMTIHASKGLEYPIVFCPYLWHHPKPRLAPPVLSFHQADDHKACVTFGGQMMETAKLLNAEEQTAEDLRLLYVALTRARDRCIIPWGNVKEVEQTALFSLLHPDLNDASTETMQQQLTQLIADNSTCMTLDQQSQLDSSQVMLSEQEWTLSARQFKGEISRPWMIGSFTGLTRGYHLEQPDHDADSYNAISRPSRVMTQDRFGFPRGANAGSCLHKLLELWDFQTIDDAWRQQVSKTLVQYGIDESWQSVVVAWLAEVVETPLANGLSLKLIEPAKRLDEMEFYFPVTALTPKSLEKTLSAFTDEIPLLEQILPQLNFYFISGFMKGFIDLVFEHQGRFYIADYKSNCLGEQVEDYATANLDEAMAEHAYPLQYLIYSIALHRYLQLRLSDYDPSQHFGGVYYLFIRGMKPSWEQAGVYAHQPSLALLNALDACLSELPNE